MNDGRFLTSYVRGRVFDQYVRNVNNINSSHEYKNFLQENGDFIMNNLKAHYRETNTCKIEGRCLPMSGPTNDNMNDYLKSNDKNSDWYEQVETMSKMNEYNSDNIDHDELLFQEHNENKKYDTLNAQTANELAQNIYNNMRVHQEQRNLQQDDDNKNCTFCNVTK